MSENNEQQIPELPPTRSPMTVVELQDTVVELEQRLRTLETAMMQITQLQHSQAISTFESIGQAIMEVGNSYREQLVPKDQPTGVFIHRVSDDEPENDQSMYIRLNDQIQAEAGTIEDGTFQPTYFPEFALPYFQRWLVAEQAGINQPQLVNVYFETAQTKPEE